ncbi:MAG TPA: glycosyltransferase family 2 protein [Tepidisphaeraceae bacterium]|nr:glycosyltransferase family 2 protein [Tepidisphaeraceae bacterium]
MKVSIITPSLNQCAFMRQTAESILLQKGEFDLQWIVVDGGSTDGTIEFLHDLADPRLVFSSEPDGGQSDAINKGLARADGEIIGWLNSDDLYLPGTLETVCRAFADNPDALWLIGRCEIIDADGNVIRRRITRYKDRQLSRYSYRRLLRENFVSQPAVFWRRDFGERIGKLDESLHFTMDYDLWCRMGRADEPLILPGVLSRFRLHTSSKSGAVNRRQFDEGLEVAERYLGGDRLSWLIHRFNVEKIVWSYRAMKLLKFDP